MQVYGIYAGTPAEGTPTPPDAFVFWAWRDTAEYPQLIEIYNPIDNTVTLRQIPIIDLAGADFESWLPIALDFDQGQIAIRPTQPGESIYLVPLIPEAEIMGTDDYVLSASISILDTSQICAMSSTELVTTHQKVFPLNWFWCDQPTDTDPEGNGTAYPENYNLEMALVLANDDSTVIQRGIYAASDSSSNVGGLKDLINNAGGNVCISDPNYSGISHDDAGVIYSVDAFDYQETDEGYDNALQVWYAVNVGHAFPLCYIKPADWDDDFWFQSVESSYGYIDGHHAVGEVISSYTSREYASGAVSYTGLTPVPGRTTYLDRLAALGKGSVTPIDGVFLPCVLNPIRPEVP
jgi:hypothetical protein